MHFEEFNNNKNNDTEYYLKEIVENQKKTINLLRFTTILVLAIIVIKLFVTG